MRILGLSAFFHDSAAALVEDGRVVAAAQEERFSRVRHDAAFPAAAIGACLAQAGWAPRALDRVVFYEKPFLKFERLLETYVAFAPRGFRSFATAMPAWVKDKLFQRSAIVEALRAIDASVDWGERLRFAEHHESHAASAFFPSPFARAAILTLDGVGEWATTSTGLGDGSTLTLRREQQFPHSTGLLYSAFTYYTGFRVNSGEYKVMGLAPYGVPRFADRILANLLDLKEDGSFRLDMRYFDYCTGLRMTNARFDDLFEGPPRSPDAPLMQRDMDLAASMQAVVEEIVRRLVRSLVAETGERRVCLAGGVALNCVANGRLVREKLVDALWVQPAAGDAGGALGAALACWHREGGARVTGRDDGVDGMSGSYLGPAVSQEAIKRELAALGAAYTLVPPHEVPARTADLLAQGRVVGWHQGRMEFGPRALGARSILADPRSAAMQSIVNQKVKFRESFRPFAPAIPRERLSEWFDLDVDSPYMLLVADVAASHRRPVSAADDAAFGLARLGVPRSDIPAVTHVDYSARVQTVHRETNPRFHALLEAFDARTGCPVLLNTSFNVRGEPIVCTVADAFRCFMGTAIDALVIGDCLLLRANQPAQLVSEYASVLAPD